MLWRMIITFLFIIILFRTNYAHRTINPYSYGDDADIKFMICGIMGVILALWALAFALGVRYMHNNFPTGMRGKTKEKRNEKREGRHENRMYINLKYRKRI